MKNVRWLALMTLILTIAAGCAVRQEPEETTAVSKAFPSITTAELAEKQGGDWVILDARLTDSYNGWALNGEERGGHIAGAVDFSAVWLGADDEVLSAALTEKGIEPDKNVVIYDAGGNDAQKVAEYLNGLGFEDLYLYDVKEWAADEALPMERYPNYQMIVPAQIVKQILDGGNPATFENAGVIKMVDAGWGGPEESYDAGHIPSSFHIDTDTVEPPPEWMLDSDENLANWALEYGFHKDDTVIVSGADQMAAYRVAVVLRYVGVSDVRVLNGANAAWTAAGYELETEGHSPVASEEFGAEIPVNADLIVTIPELKERLEQPEEYVLVDNRQWDEYIGESTGYSYHDKAGRIPGAVFGYAGTEGSGSLNYFRNPDGTMRNADEILALWKDIDLDKHLMFMCGSGWRAAEVLYYAQVAGLTDTSLYSDGWIGWSNGGNPSETGE
jgi:thiosulfate/3-mercaptopyruvate sulfurtransferase